MTPEERTPEEQIERLKKLLTAYPNAWGNPLNPRQWLLYAECYTVQDWRDFASSAAQPILCHHAGLAAALDHVTHIVSDDLGANKLRGVPREQTTVEVPIDALVHLEDAISELTTQFFEVGVVAGWSLARTWPEQPEDLNEWVERAVLYGKLHEPHWRWDHDEDEGDAS